ncbi:NAD(P)/FAD-dependent oxidoreductase [Paraburkholderia dipogonis]|uniref:NAD(P)/FAD-dependent oxidoreductase n=1 Tax=Paraburkholderia dipogonis TaxID=1211383 RepID=A0A4Y8MGD4_9BURK|nr:NAD(P)/FAD-dependent oxidoreductase [Paraburkholderia dipogonis]TFE36510.1 NAD(P)/FAD-dependent oxidoreductase [Paraburkholderia dipogonis]
MTVHAFPSAERVDVLIVGAGLSGIGLACYLQKERPGSTYLVLEGRGTTGGTWDLFRYPGIRSDSDLNTFGYEFKPWVHEKAIAGADAILSYLRQAAAENHVDRQIRLHHKVIHASWSSEDAHWTVDVERTDTGERKTFTARWLFSAAGYYRYDQGYTPQFDGIERFQGRVIHPQHWPESLDYTGKRVVVIGSGATAVTLVPSMADKASHVTMLQRTPTYVMSLPSEDVIANALGKVLPRKWAYAVTRRKNIALARGIWRFCQRRPKTARRLIRYLNKRQLPKGYPVDTHFNPPYSPWDQRLCAVPDGDLFKAIREGKASVVTDRIRAFSEGGIVLESGHELSADIVVTATGLNLQVFGGIGLSIDGLPVDLSSKVAFKGMMLDGVPNFAFAIGYTNSSWTLKVGLVSEHFCRLLTHMDRTCVDVCIPELPSRDMPTRPLMNFGAGYVQRAMKDLPRQGLGAPWVISMDYYEDVDVLRHGPIEHPCLQFWRASDASVQRGVEVRRVAGV